VCAHGDFIIVDVEAPVLARRRVWCG
jgi:hypothetical protein